MEDPEGGREGGGKSVTSYFAYYTKHISLYYVLCFPSDYLGGSWVFFSVPRANLSDALIFDPTSF